MKILLVNIRRECTKENLIAAISCLVLSLCIFFIMKVTGR